MMEMFFIGHSSIATERASGKVGERSRRLLICTPFPPRLDARHGGRATAQLLARLAARHEVALLFLRAKTDGPVDDVFVGLCAQIEEIPVCRAATARFGWWRRARWALGLLKGLPPWATDC